MMIGVQQIIILFLNSNVDKVLKKMRQERGNPVRIKISDSILYILIVKFYKLKSHLISPSFT